MEFSGLHRIRSQVRHMILLRVLLMQRVQIGIVGGCHLSLPKMEFPKFDGSNPRWWRDQCELYFEIYSVAPFLKTRFAALNFVAPASVWL